MSDLPRRPVEPLPPPAGQFDAVLARAKTRRMRRLTTVLTVSGVFVAGVAGGLALDRPVTSVPSALVRLAGGGGPGSGPAAPAGEPSNAASVVREKKSRPAATSPAPERQRKSPPPTEPSTLALRTPSPDVVPVVTGTAVGVSGQPAAGLFIYPGEPGADGFVPTAEPVGRTAADGSFSLACTGTPVLLSPWRVNEPVGPAAATATWAATFVGGVTDAQGALAPPCGSARAATRTVVQQGSTVSGTVELPEVCRTASLPLWVWLHNERTLSVRLPDLRHGDTYRVGGLPPGQHTLGANGSRSTVTVGGGQTFERDVTFACDAGEPSPSPSSTPAPSGSPSPTTTGSPPPSDPAPTTPVSSGTPTGAARG